MKILVIDVAAEYAGALTILKDFIKEASNHRDIEWTILVSQNGLALNIPNIKIVSFPWTKRSWIHRLYFETIYLKKIVDYDKYSHVISLQNTFLVLEDTKDVSYTSHLLIHHPVQFFRGFLNPLNFEGFKMILRKYLIGSLIKYSSRRVDNIYVQTNWMKEEVLKWDNGNSINVRLINSILIDDHQITFSLQDFMKERAFIYPAAAGYVKNHIIILKALKYLKNKYNESPKVIFTINDNENQTSKRLYRYVTENKLNVSFIGRIERERLFTYYTKCSVVFPSLIETYGLPLYEAVSFNTPIVAIDLPYAHEALDDYPNKEYFKDHKELAKKMLIILDQNNNFTQTNHYIKPINDSLIDIILGEKS